MQTTNGEPIAGNVTNTRWGVSGFWVPRAATSQACDLRFPGMMQNLLSVPVQPSAPPAPGFQGHPTAENDQEGQPAINQTPLEEFWTIPSPVLRGWHRPSSSTGVHSNPGFRKP